MKYVEINSVNIRIGFNKGQTKYNITCVKNGNHIPRGRNNSILKCSKRQIIMKNQIFCELKLFLKKGGKIILLCCTVGA